MVTKIGLDLGYANITLSDVNSGVYREPSHALVEKSTSRIIALGEEATHTSMDGAILVRPFKNGLLYSADMTRAIIENAIRAIQPGGKVRALIALPSDFLPRQERELYGMLEACGVEEVYGVYRSVAALVGAGYAPSISAISVNVGARYTDIAVMHGGKVILKSTEEVGGEDFDNAVRTYIQEQGDVNVSLSIARAIKEKIGAVWEGKPCESIDIDGTLSLTGNRVQMTLTSEDVLGVFEQPLHAFLRAVANQVKKIPVEMVEAVFQNGILLSGGGAMLYGMDKMLEKILDIPVTLAQYPMDCVSRGMSRIHTFIPVRMRSNHKNITPQLAKYYETKKTTKV